MVNTCNLFNSQRINLEHERSPYESKWKMMKTIGKK